MSKKSGIIIDESTHRAVPTIFQRIWHSILATFFGAILSQVMLFAFKGGSLVLLINNYMFIAYLIGCAIFGAVYGDRFISTIRKHISEWWDLWGGWWW